MKAWRRSSTMAGAQQTPTVPVIVSVSADGSADVIVLFDSPVTWDNVDPGSLQIEADPMTWVNQIDAVTLLAEAGSLSPKNPGDAWALAGPEPGLSPSPAVPESGICI